MSQEFTAAMRRATQATRAMDVAGATRIIGEALGIGIGRDTGLPAMAPPEPAARPLRRRLGEVVRLLKAGKRAIPGLDARAHPPLPERPVPEGATFAAGRFAGPSGARDYRLYLPASLDGAAPQGLVLMLHGCTQTPEDFAAGTGMNELAETHRLIVVYPSQTRAENPAACWNWFRPGDQGREAGEPAILAGLARAMAEEHGVPPGRVFAAGLSAGGAMAAVLGATWPDLFAAVGVHSGLAHGSASDVVSAFAAMRGEAAPPREDTSAASADVIVFHGSADRTVHPSNAARVAGTAGRPAHRSSGVAPGGRRYERLVTEPSGTGPRVECWMVEGAGHAWSGGRPEGSYTDATGPDASAEMVRFFLDRPKRGAAR
ncbi:MAG: PHB depolymerase family esterase [Rhodovulum sp.]|nr:PHB depolymerase family esterase [Rhodovulum sp.]